MTEALMKSDKTNETSGGSPVVTIGVPVYNGADKLRRALDNLLNQTFQDFELIISDNASTDSTKSICEEYVKLDPRIRYIRQERNIGAPANWNAVVYPAKGRYFKWASANDICEPTYLEMAVKTLDENPDAVLCYGRTELVDEEDAGRRVYENDLDVSDNTPSMRFAKVRQFLELNNAQQGVIRADILLKTRLDRMYPNGDMVLMAELALYGKFILLPQVLLHRSCGKNSMTSFLDANRLQKVFNPDAKRPIRFNRGRSHLDYIFSILRAKVPMVDKAKAIKTSVNYILWDRNKLWHELTGRDG